MDPNTLLAQLRESARIVLAAAREDEWAVSAIELQMSEDFAALDEWLSKGGFKPADWSTETLPESSKVIQSGVIVGDL